MVELASRMVAACYACCQSGPVDADQGPAAVVFVAVRWEVDPSADREGRWAAAEVGMVPVGSLDRVVVRIPFPCRILVVEAHIPYRIRVPHRAALGSHARRQDPEILDAAGIGWAAGLGSHTAAVAGDREAVALGTDSAAVKDAAVASGMARRVRVAKGSRDHWAFAAVEVGSLSAARQWSDP